jgi:hypothetical protein
MITQSKLRELLDYNETTGIFIWKYPVSIRIKVGSEAGCKCSDGYIRIRIYGNLYLAHRLAWLYKFGKFPPIDIDHINRNRIDNRISNLRSANRSMNMKNGNIRKDNKSGTKGVSWNNERKKWQVMIASGGKYKFVGRFSKKEDAIKKRIEAEINNNY